MAFNIPIDGENGNHTHDRYKNIRGEAIKESGNLKGMDLGSVRLLVPILQCQAKYIRYGLGDKGGLEGTSSRGCGRRKAT